MSLFVPEWVDVSARELNVKRVLGALDDDHIVRRPLRPFGTSGQAGLE